MQAWKKSLEGTCPHSLARPMLQGNITLFGFLAVQCSASIAPTNISMGVEVDVLKAAPLTGKITDAFTAVFHKAAEVVNKTAAAIA